MTFDNTDQWMAWLYSVTIIAFITTLIITKSALSALMAFLMTGYFVIVLYTWSEWENE